MRMWSIILTFGVSKHGFTKHLLFSSLSLWLYLTYYTYYYDDEADDFEANISKNYLSFVLTTQACADNAQAW